uniref:Cytochrome c oxidase assembly protein COX11, mitochondrial n=1 Tax=Gasterosteus aculeatus aculeatus TaxID=481459 RepID=A0AAQ4QIQ6_GASAC
AGPPQHAAPRPAASVPLLRSGLWDFDTVRPDTVLPGRALPAPPAQPGPQGWRQEVPEPGGEVEEQEQDGADVHRRGWRGDDWPDVRLRAAVPPLLPSELLLPAVCQRPRLLAHLTVCPLSARQASGLGGAAVAGHDTEQVETMEPVKGRVLKISFNADTHASMQWNFRPQQSEIFVVPGETALAFYRAKNPTNKPIIGISTYNVVPFDAGQYFNKIQCFCFEEQRLNPHEEVDMPVFFYIDPEFDEDPRMARVDTITLSYTFFEAKEGQKLPLPGYSYN